MKDKIVGHKKSKQEATVIRDQSYNEHFVSKDNIKKVTVKYVFSE